ncbi:hypothetical protein ACKZDW_04165 (plasmid) [Ralstonia syzygii subsp. celebesensis]|nr:hypothetical protein [Ralstonia syzygii]QQV57722.1 hypothetical protein JK151_19950 [Ralstonia syzygii subsp. celebesensis]
MHLSDNDAAQRAADRENRVTEYMRRKRWNVALNAAALAVMVYVAVVELIKHGVL